MVSVDPLGAKFVDVPHRHLTVLPRPLRPGTSQVQAEEGERQYRHRDQTEDDAGDFRRKGLWRRAQLDSMGESAGDDDRLRYEHRRQTSKRRREKTQSRAAIRSEERRVG